MTNSTRGGFRITTNSEDFEIDNGDMPSWLQLAADSIVGKNAVEVARERTESIADQINSIMGHGSNSKFSTVEDAVTHYQNVTGLADYLNKVQSNHADINKKASVINFLPFEDGLRHGAHDVKNKQWGDIAASFNAYLRHMERSGVNMSKYKSMNGENSTRWKDVYKVYKSGYLQAIDDFGGIDKYLDFAKINADPEYTSEDIDNMHKAYEFYKNANAEVTQPSIFTKFPEIKFFIDNLIRTRHGHIHIPAIQQDILDVFKSRGVNTGDIDDPALMQYINKMISYEEGQVFEPTHTDLGRGVGVSDIDKDQAGNDTYNFINPAK